MNKAVKMLMGLIALAAIVIGVMYFMKLGPFESEAHWWHHIGHDIKHGLHDIGHGVRDVGRGALHIAEHPIRSTEHGFEHVGHFMEHPIRHIEDGWHWLFGHHHHNRTGKQKVLNTPPLSPYQVDSVATAAQYGEDQESDFDPSASAAKKRQVGATDAADYGATHISI
tara:strand:- start:276 stop:779 length:504 start_codon:yes stop_codon:yes gene_type:complete